MGTKMDMAEQEDRLLTEMLDIIRFTEGVSAKLHLVTDEAKIYQVVKDEFAKSGRYLASILLLADDSASLRIVETSMLPSKLEVLEKASGLKTKEYLINLSKSSIFRQVVGEGETIQANVGEMIREFLPQPVAYLISKTMGYDKQSSILTPLYKHGKVAGVLVMSCNDLCEYFTHSVENLALHISTALELAHEHAQRNRALQTLKRYHDHLGELVEERTAELKKVNEKLLEEIGERKRAEETLAGEVTRRRILVDQSLDGIVVLDEDARVYEANQRFAEMLGYTPEEVRELHTWDWDKNFPPEKLLEMGRAVDEKGLHLETKHHRKDGTVIDVDISINGAVVAGQKLIFCVCRDVTERKRAEQALRKIEQEKSAILNSMSELMVYQDTGHRVLWANKVAAESVALSIEQLVGRRCYEIWHQRNKPCVGCPVAKARESGKSQEAEMTTPDGRVWFVRGYPIRDVNKDLVGVVEVALDITERKRAEEALRESEEKYKGLAESITDVFFAFDKDLRYTYWNKASEELTGVLAKDALGKHLYDIFPESGETRKAEKHYLKALRTQQVQSFMNEYYLRGKDYVFEISAYPSKDGLSVFVKDVTERKQAEEALQSEKNKLQSLIDAMEYGLTIQDRDYNIIYQNEPSKKGAGGDCVGEKCYRAYEGRDEVCEECPVEKAFKDGKSHTAERRRVEPSGEVTLWENTANPIRDARGRIVACLEVTRDITQRKRAEEALAGEVTRRRILVDQSLDGIVVLDEDAKVVEANQRFAEMLGYTPEEVRELHTWDWDKQFPPEKLLEMGRAVDEKGLHLETKHHRKDGTVIDVDISINGVVVAGQKLIFCVCRDVTERKRGEEALQSEKNKLQSLIDAIGDGFNIRDKDYNLIYQNEPERKTWGDHVGEKCYRVYEGRDEVCEGCPAEKAFKDGKSHTAERRVVTPSGRVVFWDNTASPIRDARGEIVACLEVTRDITERKQAEEALWESREKFQTMFESVTDAISLIDLNGVIIETNQRAVEMHGFTSKDELVGRKALELVAPCDRERILANMRRAIKGGAIRGVEYTLPRADGTEFPGELSTNVIRDASGEPVAHITIARDITERKRAEEALKESEERFRSIVENSQAGIMILDDAYRLVYVNDELCHISGYSHEEAIGQDFRKFLDEESKELVADRYIRRQRGEEVVPRYEFNIVGKDGQKRRVEISSAVIKDSAGKVKTVAQILDITERKRAEEALQSEKNKLQSIMDAMEDYLTIRDKDYNLIYEGELAKKLLGDHLGEKCYRVFEGREEVCEGCPVEKSFKDGKSHVAERKMVMPSGEVIFWENTANPIRDAGGRIVACLEIARNITERKKEEQLQRDENYVLTLLGQGAKLNELLDSIVRLGESRDPLIKGSVMLLDPSKERLFLASAPSLPDDYKALLEGGIPIGPKAGSCGTAAYRKERVIVPDMANSPLFKPFKEAVKGATRNGLLACWSQPIISSKGELLGTIANYGTKVGEPSADNLRVIEWSARIAAIAIERTRAEEALRESEEKYKTLAEDATIGIYFSDFKGTFLYGNKKAEEITGYKREELLGKSFLKLKLLDPQGLAKAIKLLALNKLGKATGPDSFVLRRKDGTKSIVEIRTRITTVGGKKVVLGMVEDITERTRAEEALRESQRFSSSLLAGSPNPILVINLDTSVRYVNPAVEKLTGFTSAEIGGKKAPYPWWPEGKGEQILASFKDAIEHGGRRTERNFQKKNGERFWVVINSAPVMQDGKPVYMIISWLDVTERKRAEEKEKQLQRELYLAQRLASVGELAAGVAHEINNPLTGVLGFSQRLMRKSTDEKVSRDLEIIHSEARRAADVVQNLLTFARRRHVEKEYTNINDIVQRTLELRAYALQTNNIEVTTTFAPSLPEVMVDFPQMQEVFLNIILNAEQAMSDAHGRGALTIKSQRIKDYVRVSFADNGPGISPENLDKVFDPFFTTREDKGGTGLGLSACHGIVTEHGGKIYVRSKPGKGATFVVELPLSPPENTVMHTD